MPRQQPGHACEQCRSKKLRCDRAHPTCGTCQSQGVHCNQTTVPQPRGPKPGHIRALKARIAELERRVGDSLDSQEDDEDAPDAIDSWNDQQQPVNPARHATNSGMQSDESSNREALPTITACTDNYVNLDTGPYHDDLFDRPPSCRTEGVQSAQLDSQMMFSLDQPGFEPAPPTSHDNPLTGPCSRSPFQMNSSGDSTSSSQMLMSMDYEPSQNKSFGGFMSPISLSLVTPPSKSMPLPLDSSSASSSQPTSGSCTPAERDEPPLRLSDLVRTDLNHLYFDRVHPSVPILNQRNYFARAASTTKPPTTAFKSLQFAMWTLAASMGTQFQPIQSQLYSQARALLKERESEEFLGTLPLEHVQAWTLLAFYEFTQAKHQLSWVSAGHSFRLVQLMGLDKIDMSRQGNDDTAGPLTGSDLPWVEVEERRRTFWMAYLLDRCINLVDELPLSINEHLIGTRLPVDEHAFQRQQPTQADFLGDVMSQPLSNGSQLSPFAESIVSLTLSGRCLLYMQQRKVERLQARDRRMSSLHHENLDRILSRSASRSQRGNECDGETSPLLHFSDTTAQATILLLFSKIPMGYEDKAFQAAQNILRLARKLTELSYFKVHPFISMPLFLCARFLQGQSSLDPVLQSSTDVIIEFLNYLSAVNKLAQTYLGKLSFRVNNDR